MLTAEIRTPTYPRKIAVSAHDEKMSKWGDEKGQKEGDTP